jgi:hypothetical protein
MAANQASKIKKIYFLIDIQIRIKNDRNFKNYFKTEIENFQN